MMNSIVQAEDVVFKWAKRLGGTAGDYGYTVTTDDLGNIFLGGLATGDADLNGDGDTLDAGESATGFGGTDIVFTAFSATGAHLWSMRLGGTGADSPGRLAMDSLGQIIFTGSVTGDADLNGDGDTLDAGESATGFGDTDIILTAFSTTGTHLWAMRLGGAGKDTGAGITIDISGNVIFTGSVTGDADLNGDSDTVDLGESSVGFAQQDIFITVFNSSMTHLWARRLGWTYRDEGDDVITDTSGNIYLTGSVKEDVDLNWDGDKLDSGETALNPSSNRNDIVLIAFNASGDFRWAKRLGGIYTEECNAVRIDSQQRVIVTGSTEGSGDLNGDGDFLDEAEENGGISNSSPFISIFDTNGNHLWAKRMGGDRHYEYAFAAAIDDKDNIIVPGRVAGNADLDGDPDTDDGGPDINDFSLSDAYITSFSASGSHLWAKRIRGETGDNWTRAVTLSPSGDLIATGQAQNAVDFNGDGDTIDGDTENVGYGGTDIFIVSFTPDFTPPTVSMSEAIYLNTSTYNYIATGTDSQVPIQLIEYQLDKTSSSWISCLPQDGNFDEQQETISCSLSELLDGTHTIYIRATDVSNNTSEPFQASFVVDTIAPDAVNLTQPSWASRTDNLTPTFQGTGEIDAALKVWLDGTIIGITTIDVSGNWAWKPSNNLTLGTHTIEFSAVDSFENEGTKSSPFTFQVVDDYDEDGLTTSDESNYGTDSHDSDTDDDGSNDGDEINNGTDPLDSDSDDDGVDDGQENIDGTNPLDSGSAVAARETRMCTDWNGFLGMENVLEHLNMGSSKIEVVSQLYDAQGKSQGSLFFGIKSGSQYDILVNNLVGFTKDSYGKVCSTLYEGSAGDLDGRMMQYKPGTNGGIEFVLAMPFTNGTKGIRYVPWNTYHPSLDPADSNNTIANWIQVTNLENRKERGTLEFYDLAGDLLSTQEVFIAEGGRTDYAAHEFGKNLAGLVKWTPERSDSHFIVKNVRYYYNNPELENSFDGAIALNSRVGSGELQVVPLDATNASAVIEISNTTANMLSVDLKVYNEQGELLEESTLKLGAYGTHHIILDGTLKGSRGIATLKGNKHASVMAHGVSYSRTGTGGIQTAYVVEAREALGSVLRGSYNTFLGQDCELLLSNPTVSDKTVSITVKQYDGTEMVSGEEVSIPAKGLTVYPLCERATNIDVYGVVSVMPNEINTVTAEVVRIGADNQYRLAIPVRQ